MLKGFPTSGPPKPALWDGMLLEKAEAFRTGIRSPCEAADDEDFSIEPKSIAVIPGISRPFSQKNVGVVPGHVQSNTTSGDSKGCTFHCWSLRGPQPDGNILGKLVPFLFLRGNFIGYRMCAINGDILRHI